MATTQQILDVARSQLGRTEQPAGSNCNKFSHDLGRPCEPWCADFLVWCARQVGLVLPSESAYTPAMVDAFKKAGRWSTTPQVGAFAFWDFPDRTSGVQHVSVVESFDGQNVTSIDGNSSAGGSQDNGGEVVRRTRTRKWVVGYGYPLYTTQTSLPTSFVAGPTVEFDMKLKQVKVAFTTGDHGEANVPVPVAIDDIVSIVGPGLRPNSDHRYLEVKAGVADEDGHTVLSTEGWEAHQSETVRLWVVDHS